MTGMNWNLMITMPVDLLSDKGDSGQMLQRGYLLAARFWHCYDFARGIVAMRYHRCFVDIEECAIVGFVDPKDRVLSDPWPEVYA